MSSVAEMAAKAVANKPYLGRVIITMNPNGSVGCQVDVPDRTMFNAMIETARQEIVAMMMERERKAREATGGLVVAPPGVEVERNPKA